MSEAVELKHHYTPGPWRLVGNTYVYAENDGYIGDIHRTAVTRVVAAPLMLDALKSLVESLYETWVAGEGTEWAIAHENLMNSMDKAELAIAAVEESDLESFPEALEKAYQVVGGKDE